MSELLFLLLLLLLLQVKTQSKWDRVVEQDSEDEVNGRYESFPWLCHCELYRHHINIKRRGAQICVVLSDYCASLSTPGNSSKSLGRDEDSRSDNSDASGGSRGNEMSEFKRKRLREVEASTYLNELSETNMVVLCWSPQPRKSHSICSISEGLALSSLYCVTEMEPLHSQHESINQTLFLYIYNSSASHRSWKLEILAEGRQS